MNVLDRVLRSVNPQRALNRAVARKRYDMIVNSGYDESGASRRKNSMKGWNADSKSPQKDIDRNLNLLRKRSRSLFMSAPLARSAIISNRTNIIGPGLVLKPRIDYSTLGITNEKAKELGRKIEREFQLWSESKLCDNNHQHNFMELQQIAFVSWLMNGDCFSLIRYSDTEQPMMPYRLRIKLIEGDKVSTPNSGGDYLDLDYKNKENGNKIINGIEVNENGTVVAYHICNRYLDDYDADKNWYRVESYGKETGNPNVLHIFEAERCEQYRGVPFLSPVIESIKQLTRYTEAEIMAAVINGMFTVFVKTEEGEDNIDFDGVEDENDKADDDQNSYELGNGLINYMKAGESIEIADPKRPNVNFDGFVSAMSKYIGAALEVPVELLTKNFTASYSASRAALLEAWKAFRMRRKWFVNNFTQPIYELWLSEAVATGRINAPGFFRDPIIRKAYCRAEWNGPSQGQLNPEVEVKAAESKVRNGFSTRERETIELTGGDFDVNIEQLKIENEKMKEIGLFEGGENAKGN